MPQDKTYLQLRGETWYARVIVPPSLRDQLGTHLRRSLGTKSLPEANRRKHTVVGELKRQIEQAKHGTTWKDWRELLRKAKDEEQKDEIHLQIIEDAEAIEAKQGYPVAKEFFRKATQVESTLSELVEDFLALDHSTDTRRKHDRALRDLLDYFREDDVPPASLSPRDLLKFTDALSAGPLAPNTKRDRLGSLGKFWDWLERRLHAPKGSNPFRGVTIRGGTVEEFRAFTDDEVAKLLSSEFTHDWQRRAFTILLLTGARPNEILGLTHGDIDPEAQTIAIRAAKTDAGIRTLPYRHPRLVEAIAGLWKGDPEARELRVFPDAGPDEKPAKNFINYFSRHKERLKLPAEVGLYSARKTFMGKCLDLELDVVNVERYFGHKNQRLALSTYSKGRSDAGLVAVAEGVSKGWKL